VSSILEHTLPSVVQDRTAQWASLCPSEQIVSGLHVRARQDRRHDADDSLPAFVHPSMIRLSSFACLTPVVRQSCDYSVRTPDEKRAALTPGLLFSKKGNALAKVVVTF
jgi:hypothetical protein